MTGWHGLAEYYTTHEKFIGKKWRHCTVLMRYRLSYEMSTTIGADDGGLFLSLFFIFRPGHPNLFIPWQDIRITKEKKWWFNYRVLTTSKQPHIKLRVPEKLAENLGEKLQPTETN